MTSSDGFWHQSDLLRCKFIPSESRFETEMGINGCCCIIHCLGERKEFPYWIFFARKFARKTFKHCVTGRARLISYPSAGVIILEGFYFPLLTTRNVGPFVRKTLSSSLYHKSCQLTLWELSKTSLFKHYADNPLRIFHKTPWKSIVRLFLQRKFKEKWTALGKVFSWNLRFRPEASEKLCAKHPCRAERENVGADRRRKDS